MHQKLFGFVLLGALSTSWMLHAVPGDNPPPETTPLAQAQEPTDTTPPIVFSHVATAPEEELHPSRLEQIRDNLSEELGADFQALTEKQKGLMIDIMKKVHDVVPELHIQLMQASARWQPTEAADHEARCLEKARQALEQQLTPALGSQEAGTFRKVVPRRTRNSAKPPATSYKTCPR